MRLWYFTILQARSQAYFIIFLPLLRHPTSLFRPSPLQNVPWGRNHPAKGRKKSLTNLLLSCIIQALLARISGRLAQLARASAWRAEGHRFESYIVHHTWKSELLLCGEWVRIFSSSLHSWKWEFNVECIKRGVPWRKLRNIFWKSTWLQCNIWSGQLSEAAECGESRLFRQAP